MKAFKVVGLLIMMINSIKLNPVINGAFLVSSDNNNNNKGTRIKVTGQCVASSHTWICRKRICTEKEGCLFIHPYVYASRCHHDLTCGCG